MVPVLQFIRKFIDDNPLCVCRGEVAHIQQKLIEEGDQIKLKQKTSQVHLTVRGGAYFIRVALTVPDLYPLEKLGYSGTYISFVSPHHCIWPLACHSCLYLSIAISGT